jgi:hypothetical protein
VEAQGGLILRRRISLSGMVIHRICTAVWLTDEIDQLEPSFVELQIAFHRT